MRVPPKMEGYDEGGVAEADCEERGVDYSEEGLRKLKGGSEGGPRALPRARVQVVEKSGLGSGGREESGDSGRRRESRLEEWNLGSEKWSKDGNERAMRMRGETGDMEQLAVKVRGRKADPFSEEWKEGTARGGLVNDDGDILVVDDFTGVGDVENAEGEFVSDVGLGGSDEDEWEAELLRRVGRADLTGGDEMMKRARRIVREADEVPSGVTEVGRSLQKVREAREEWERRLKVGEEKLGTLVVTVDEGAGMQREMEGEVRRLEERIAFYEKLKEFADNVMDMFREKKEQILVSRGELLARLAEEAEEVKNMLEGGVDEFGRRRLVTLGGALPKVVENKVDVLADVEDDVKCVEKVVKMFREWKTRYGDDYNRAFGDAGLGKIVGKLVLANGGTGFDDVRSMLDETQKKEMWKAADGGSIVPVLVRARWCSWDLERCAEYGVLGREVIEADAGSMDKIVEAFRERGRWEMEGCVKLEEWARGIECMRGIVEVTREIGRDVGLEDALKRVEKMEVEKDILNRAEKEIEWIAGISGDDYVGEECVRVARRMCDKMGWEWVLRVGK